MANPSLQAVHECGWSMGLANLLRKENGTWWRTRRWWVQGLLWLFLLNGLLAAVPWTPSRQPVSPAEAGAAADSATAGNEGLDTIAGIMQDKPTAGVFIFLLMSGLALPIASIIAGQDVIISEKQSGTAAWVLSRPVSRPAFILSKLVANGLGFLGIGVIVQGAVAAMQITLAAGEPRLGIGFAGALGLIYLNLMFYFSLTLMLGTLFDSRGPVLGIPLALLLGYQLWLGIVPELAMVMPWALVLNVLAGGLPLSVALALGVPLPTLAILPVAATVLWCLIFATVAIRRFQREEF